jgi:hypothetical protein
VSDDLLAVALPACITALGLVVVKVLDIRFAARRERATRSEHHERRRQHRGEVRERASLLARLERLDRERGRERE